MQILGDFHDTPGIKTGPHFNTKIVIIGRHFHHKDKMVITFFVLRFWNLSDQVQFQRVSNMIYKETLAGPKRFSLVIYIGPALNTKTVIIPSYFFLVGVPLPIRQHHYIDRWASTVMQIWLAGLIIFPVSKRSRDIMISYRSMPLLNAHRINGVNAISQKADGS